MLRQREGIDDIADRFRHFLAAVEQKAVREHAFWRGDAGRHQKRRPVDSVKADNVLADDMHIGRPEGFEIL